MNEAGTVSECHRADARYRIRYRDVCQPLTFLERSRLDVGHRRGNDEAAGIEFRALDERGLRLVEQNPVNAAVTGVSGVHVDRRQ